MRNAQEAVLTDFENQMEQAKSASCHLIDIEIAIDSFLVKRKERDEGMKIATELKSAECNIPLSCRRQSFYQSP